MLIKPIDFFSELKKVGINFFTGVPDSLLKELCFCIENKVSKNNHIIAANEGNAIALAAGYHLSTRKIPLVYMQNAGFGNAINPLLSLCDKTVYSIPMLILVGWRGEPGFKDEPQHKKQGLIQKNLLKAMQLPFGIISRNDKAFKVKINKALKKIRNTQSPYVLLIKDKVFDKYKKNIKKIKINNKILREKALEIVLQKIHKDSVIISTTGKTSRELFELRKKNKQNFSKDFLTIGSMGHCSSIALGIAMSMSRKKIFCIDGDGSLLMHFGSLTTIKSLKPKNLKYILMNNETHESVGGQTTDFKGINISKVIKAINYNKVYSVKSIKDLKLKLNVFLKSKGPSFLEIKIKTQARKNLGRPNISPLQNKINFMRFLKKN